MSPSSHDDRLAIGGLMGLLIRAGAIRGLLEALAMRAESTADVHESFAPVSQLEAKRSGDAETALIFDHFETIS